jgi:hypothetical protein
LSGRRDVLRSRSVAAGFAGIVLLVGCTGDTTVAEPSFRPTIEWVQDCPSDVEILMFTRHRCGYLTVLADRSEPEGGRLQLFVTEVYPAGETPPASHVGSGFGTDLGRVSSIGDTGAGATRTNSISYSLTLRGLGHSLPTLACPEADGLEEAEFADRLSGDPGVLSSFLDAVTACRERLVASGIDPADYDVASVAQDMEDLRIALGLEQWRQLNSYGTNSRYLFEYLRRFPLSVSAAWLDSPQFPQVDEVSGAIADTRSALKQLFRACEDDRGCSATYPDLESTWADALALLERAPIHGSFRDSPHHRVDVTLDDAKLLRAARFTLSGDGPQHLTRLPAMIAAAADGRMTPDLAAIVASGRLFCAGYHPLCVAQEGFSLGNYLTVLCRDEVPFMDPSDIAAQTAGDPAFSEVFAHDPFLEACAAWDVPPGEPSVHEPVATDVPLLILPGQFDSFSQADAARDAAGTFEQAWVLEVPGQTHNAMGFNDCPIEIRNAWIMDPTSPPDTTCLEGMPSVPFTTGGMSS